MVVRRGISDREADRNLVEERRLRQPCPFAREIAPGVKNELEAADARLPCADQGFVGPAVRIRRRFAIRVRDSGPTS